jgi:hypothetical protein
MYGAVNFRCIDTEPGADTAFAPPAGFAGDDKAYAQYMRERWKCDPGVRQHLAVAGYRLTRGDEVVFVGRYADEARRIAQAVWR